jgi:DNA-directed RNA polymerase subunit RPC12/RpoP
LNFTLAHEIAHLSLGHLLIPRGRKTTTEIAMEESEADSFAGRLLMPEKLLFSCNFYSLDSVSEYFKVSKTALWMRLNNMKKLHLFNSKFVHSCPTCGNTQFSLFSEYCNICGKQISFDENGIKKFVYPDEIKLDHYKRVIVCPACGSKRFQGNQCSKCGAYIFNYCMDFIKKASECGHANLGNSRFCEMCGKPTYYFSMGVIKPWEDYVNSSDIFNSISF